MSFLTRIIERRQSGGLERRNFYNMPLIPSNLDGHMADSGEAVSERTALQLTAVYACVRILSDTIASLPLDVFRKTKYGDTFRRDEVVPTPGLIAQPWADLTDFEWKFQLMTSLALRGNSYHYVTKFDRMEFPAQLEPLHPDMVVVMYDYDTGQRLYSVNGERIPNHRIMHIRRFSLPAALVGLSPIQQARQSIGLGLAADRYGARYFGDSASPSSVLETDQDLSEEAAKNAQKQWIASHGGRRHPAVLSGGLTWRPISITPEESQFLATRSYQIADVAMLYGIPLHMLGQTERSTSWGCLPGDALVFTTSGPVPIQDVKVGDEVWSFGDNGMEPAKVSGWQMTGCKPLLTIHTRGRDLRLTVNHRVPIRRYFGKADGRGHGKCGWETIEVSAGEIRVGDHLLVPHGMKGGDRTTAPNGRELTPAVMSLCGLYIGDGSRDGNRFEIAHEVDPDHMAYYSRVIRDEFDVYPYVDKGRGTRTRFSSKDARSLLECGFTGTALTKRVPGWVFRLTPELQLAFLRGYLDADGSVQHGAIVYSSANKALLEDVRHLCIQVGVPVGKVIMGRAGGPTSVAGGPVYTSQPKYQLSLSSLRYNDLIGSNSPRKAARFVPAPTQRSLRYDLDWSGREGNKANCRQARTPGGEWDYRDVVLHKVTGIDTGTTAVPVYDIEVDGLAHFVSDGVVVHNTGIEQISIGFVIYTLRPWLSCIEAALSNLLPRGQFAKFNVDALLRGDQQGRYNAYTQARNAGWISVNEIREKEDLAPVANGDGYLQPMNYVPLGTVPPPMAAAPIAEPDSVPGADPESGDEGDDDDGS